MREKYSPNNIDLFLTKVTSTFKSIKQNKVIFNNDFKISTNFLKRSSSLLFDELNFYIKHKLDPHRKSYEQIVDFRLNQIIFPLLNLKSSQAEDIYLNLRDSKAFEAELKSILVDKLKDIKNMSLSFIRYSDIFHSGDIINFENHSCRILKVDEDSKIRIQDTLYGTKMNIKPSEIFLANPELVALREPNTIISSSTDEKFALFHSDILMNELYSYLDHKYNQTKNTSRQIMDFRFNDILVKLFGLENKSIEWISKSLNCSSNCEYYKNICFEKLAEASSFIKQKDVNIAFKPNNLLKYNGNFYNLVYVASDNVATLKNPFNLSHIKVPLYDLISANLEYLVLNK